MHWILQSVLSVFLPGRTRHFARVLMAAMLGVPCMAFASEENVVLKFSQSDTSFLGVSLGIGVFAILVGMFIRSKVLREPTGNESMQEVGRAIYEGALAYLRKQVSTMSVFVLVLAIGLGAWYGSNYNSPTLGMWIGLTFIAGVSASYIAGYVGMLMAINGNTRTANAALTSYKKALEVAFHSGAVAGLMTVGMGLIGATLILWLAGADAMKLLIGFGFGGSLAALFMRVGGGIYTKAADVGADLVGKVEAGIPEDDKRNPATIADNVGDNVGDCAGMAADVFESYEVTLVAAIVLGAATASIFDQATWMRLVLFALMARGVGIIASVIGIFSVKGSDNIDVDPLKLIRRGFFASAFVAIIGTGILSFMMMGGTGKPVGSNLLISMAELDQQEVAQIKAARAEVAKQQGVATYAVKPEDIQKTAIAKKLGLEDSDANKARPEVLQRIQRALSAPDDDAKVAPLHGYTEVDLADKSNAILKYATSQMRDPSKPSFVDLAESARNQRVFRLEIATQPAPPPQERGKPTPPAEPPKVDVNVFGPADADWVRERIDQTNKANTGMKIKVLEEYPVKVFANAEGDIALGVDAAIPVDAKGNPIKGGKPLEHPNRMGAQPFVYYTESKEKMNQLQQQQMSNTTQQIAMPPSAMAKLAIVRHAPVEWWQFFSCIVFGILMAFAIEWLTDYYVSTHKKPVREVADVSTAGPAPMIIQGFAYAKESSVFSVLAIVICLITPLLIFPPDSYGGYILGFYGIALVGLGLLTTTGYILAMDTFGPISDNAQGVFEMSGAGHDNPEASKGVQRLDAAGNTTKALTKGFAIATAVVAAVALFHSFVESAKLTEVGLRLDVPEIFLGLLIGGAAPYLFAAFSINAVGRASFQLINEVRRQFRADAGIMAGTSKPDYARCVAIVTAAAQKELLGPGILAIALPMLVAFGLSIGKPLTTIGGQEYNLTGAQALGGFLAGAIISGQLLAVLLANAGGLWDNSKKLIEDGLHGGKGTEAHKAGVVCDTVGDPFKDTAGPALNPLIKVMNLIALLSAPFIIKPLSTTVLTVITVGLVAVLAFAFYWSKRGSMAEGLQSAQATSPGGETA